MLHLLWLLIVGNWPKTPRCPEYEHGCDAPPSPLCWDGRCRMHCSQIGSCHCEKRNVSREEAQMLVEYRKAVR